MPFKLNHDRRHHIPRAKRKITNWRDYDASQARPCRSGMARWQQVIGDGLRSIAEEQRRTEVDVAVHVLNHMLELGRLISVRIG